MSKQTSATDEVYWTVGKHTRRKLHTSRQCPALQRAATFEETERAKHPNADWCQRCSGDVETGGGSRDLYELAKQIGQQRAAEEDHE